jgi:hypothetical protein
MTEKRFKTRMQQKHDIEANWDRATDFIPMRGEIIVYDSEIDVDGTLLELPEGRTDRYDYARFRIGDGRSYLKDLPFAGGESVGATGTGIQIITWGADD